MTHKDLFYFTGHLLALDEHPQFREQIIELFADAKGGLKVSPFGGDLEGALSLPPSGSLSRITGRLRGASFVQLCSDHLIIPAIYLKLKAHNILPYLPEELMQEFQKIYDLNCKRNLQILKQIDDITAILNKENIQPVFLKGTANLLDGLYSDVGERMIGDIDFLVKEEDYLRTAAILESKGYKHDEIYKLDFKSHKHYPTLCKEGEIAPVEIHWLPVRREHTRQFNAEVILRDKKEVAGKPGLYVPSNRHKVIHTFLHCQLENLGHQYKQSDFRGIYDLYLLSKRRNVSYLVGDTGYWKKAVAWFVFSQRVLGLPGRFYSPELWTAKWYCLKYDWSLSFVRTHNVYLFFKIGIRYAIRILKAIFSKDERLYIYRRLKYSKW